MSSATPESDPPPYTESATTATATAPPPQPAPAAEPPAYDHVAESLPRDQLVAGDLPTLILDNCLIYSEAQPDRPLYDLSISPATATRRAIYAVEKFMYRLSATDGEGRIHARKRHMYDVRASRPSDLVVIDSVMLEPQVSSRLAYKDVRIVPGVSQSWSSCRAAGHYEAGRSMRQRLRSHDDNIDWKRSADGVVVAVETKPSRRDDGTVDRLPRMEMKAALDAKEFDLLVTMWTARLWKASQKELDEPLSWAKCKCNAMNTTCILQELSLLTLCSQEDCVDQHRPKSHPAEWRWGCPVMIPMLSGKPFGL